MNVFADFAGWLASLDRSFLFLLTLPLFVAFAGLATLLRDRHRVTKSPGRQERLTHRN
jgi:hypothetical protein